MNAPAANTDATPEAAWLAWLSASGARSFDLSHWLHPAQRLVVVAPHPDDEVIGCGALLAAHARRGGEVLLLAVTDGEASHPGSSHWSAAALAAERCCERTRGLSCLGLADSPLHRFGLPDGQVGHHADALRSLVRGHLRANDVLLSTWRHDGHPDHEATGAAVAAVAEQCSLPLIETPVWMWQWCCPGDARVPWSRLAGFAAAAADVDAKQRALAAHATQCTDSGDGRPPVLGPSMRQRAGRCVEWLIDNRSMASSS